MKRLAILILASLLCLCLAACGEESAEVTSGSTTQPSQTTPTETTQPSEPTETTQPTQPPHEHAYEETVTEPTCTDPGYTTFTCECGDSYRSNETAVLSHDYGEYVSNNDASCYTDGTETARCSRCAASDTRTVENSKAHNYWQLVFAPNMDRDGYTLHYCLGCGDYYTDTYVEKLPGGPTHPTAREDYPFGDITMQNITTDEWNEMTLEEQDKFLEIWVDYFVATNGGKWPPEARHNWLYATVYDSYSCGWPDHVCCDKEAHEWLLSHKCATCGSTECPANFVLDPDTLYTQPDATQCPEYEEKNDPSKYCQKCGWKTGGYAQPGEECCRRGPKKDMECTWCGEMRKANECHHCVRPGAKSTSVNALIPEKKRNIF